MDPEIPNYPWQAKEAYNNIRTTSDYTPPEQKTEVEVPSKAKLLASGEGRSKDTGVFETSPGEDQDQGTLEQEAHDAMDKEAIGEAQDKP